MDYTFRRVDVRSARGMGSASYVSIEEESNDGCEDKVWITRGSAAEPLVLAATSEYQ